jgi:hypothetical protein
MKRVEEARIGALAQNHATPPAQSMSSSISPGSNLFTHLPQPGHYPLPPKPMTTQADPSNQIGTPFNKQDIKVSEAKLLRNAIFNERKARDMIKREHKKAMNGRRTKQQGREDIRDKRICSDPFANMIFGQNINYFY